MLIDASEYIKHSIGGSDNMMPGMKACPSVPALLKRGGTMTLPTIKAKKQKTLGSRTAKNILEKSGKKKLTKAA